MKRKRLKTGFTTGTAAAAAAKAAVACLLQGAPPDEVSIELLTGDRIVIPVHTCRRNADGSATCTVIKDAGDDPDVTHGAEIGARVRMHAAATQTAESLLVITAGEGVGRVTKPGLEVPPGEPAINPGPRRMIAQSVREALSASPAYGEVAVEVFVPRGQEIARKTLNARLGILGGISILGTTGIVRPMSHEAFAAAIDSALAVARAAGVQRVVLTTGRRSERFAQAWRRDLPEEAFVQIGDFFQKGLQLAVSKGFEHIILAVFFGKALKMAQGVPHTHAARADLTLDGLAKWAHAVTGNAALSRKIDAAHTAREAFEHLHAQHPAVIAHVGARIVQAAGKFAGPKTRIQSVIFDYQGGIAFDSENRC